MSLPRAALLAVAVISALTLPAPAQAATAACASTTPSDFDGDGRTDLVVAAPYATVAGLARAGSVRILYGMRTPRTLTQNTAGVGGEAETGDAFGAAVATGDFDGDGCADLAVGASEESAGERPANADGEGVVHLFRGSASGLRPVETLRARDFGARGRDEDGEGARFGAALAAGDFDGDGDDELAIGAPGLGGGGAVGVHGFRGRKPYLISQDTRWVDQDAAPTDQFGAALATGDFDGDGDDELAAGAPGDTVLKDGQGSATVIDVRRRRATLLTQDSPWVAGVAEKWDNMGAALAAADFNADGRDDLAIGVPGEGLTPKQRAMDYGDGTVHVIYGAAGGLRTATAESWSQRSLKGEPRYFDRFGAALAAADLNGDGDAELAIGVPGENAVQVLAGTRAGGLTRINNVLITGGEGDFGASLAMVDAAGRAHDLVVAAPRSGRLTLVKGGLKSKTTGAYPGVRAARTTALPAGPAASLYGYTLAP